MLGAEQRQNKSTVLALSMAKDGVIPALIHHKQLEMEKNVSGLPLGSES